jgi:protein-L-isoaspartate O-methyltransferase
MAASKFDRVYTTEIDNRLYNEAVGRSMKEGITNIVFMHGDSSKLLEDIVPRVIEGAVFFIDAHISGADRS